MTSRLVLVLVLTVASLTAACADKTPPVPPEVMERYLEDKPEELRPLYSRVLEEGERNHVLSHMRVGLAAMKGGHFALAEASFDQALLGIESVFSDTERAEDARSLWHEEGRKDFKGEPYERAMAYYYRGVLYLMRGDYENARACFKSGLLQDAFAEEEQHRADFALLVFLDGWSSQRLGAMDKARAAYDEVCRLRPGFRPPEPGHNLLVLAEAGPAPRKVRTGTYGSALTYAPGSDENPAPPTLNHGDQALGLCEVEDIYWQSSTRGGRKVDEILEGKVRFKGVNEVMGKTLTQVGLHAAANAETDEQAVVGLVVGLVGLVQMGVASQVAPEADVRQWDNLPARVYASTLSAPCEEAEITLSSTNGNAASPSGGMICPPSPAAATPAPPGGLAWFPAPPADNDADASIATANKDTHDEKPSVRRRRPGGRRPLRTP